MFTGTTYMCVFEFIIILDCVCIIIKFSILIRAQVVATINTIIIKYVHAIFSYIVAKQSKVDNLASINLIFSKSR